MVESRVEPGADGHAPVGSPEWRDETVGVWTRYIESLCERYGLQPSPEYIERLTNELADREIEAAAERERVGRHYRNRLRMQGEICAHLASGMSRVDAAQAVGIGVETFYRWMKADREFLMAVQRATRQGRGQRTASRDYHPLKMTRSVQEAIIQALRSGVTRGQAAASAGVSRQTLYAWLKKLPEFKSAVEAAEDAAAAARLGG